MPGGDGGPGGPEVSFELVLTKAFAPPPHRMHAAERKVACHTASFHVDSFFPGFCTHPQTFAQLMHPASLTILDHCLKCCYTIVSTLSYSLSRSHKPVPLTCSLAPIIHNHRSLIALPLIHTTHTSRTYTYTSRDPEDLVAPEDCPRRGNPGVSRSPPRPQEESRQAEDREERSRQDRRRRLLRGRSGHRQRNRRWEACPWEGCPPKHRQRSLRSRASRG